LGIDADLSQNHKKMLYVSIDIDVFRPETAPATGYPMPGGLDYKDVHDLLEKVSHYFQIIGFDLVEYAPNLDLKNEMTGILCAKIISEFIASIYKELQ
ncbi:MAG: arginase, partial [Candidatus Lokiarchaeota archaeon]|nr:arginase [Candidatus Lokiarchaeota archaeon]